MADEEFPPPMRLMTFVSQEQLDEAKKKRGARVEDGTAQRDRSLFEILKENKDKKDAEFNERFKHRPPKALDDDETEFFDKLEMSRRQYEQQLAEDEAQELRSFQAAVAAQSAIVHELKEISPAPPKVEEPKLTGKKNPPPRSLGMIIKVKPQAKKAKVDQSDPEGSATRASDIGSKKPSDEPSNDVGEQSSFVGIGSLVSYSDESDSD